MTWEYVAGFFDGEGSVVRNGNGFRINITQTNMIVLDDIRNFTKVGAVFAIRKREPHWKDSWMYYIANQKSIYEFLSRILPFLIVKKKQVRSVMPELLRFIEKQKRRRRLFELKLNRALKLRAQGLSYWRIGLKMDLDRGYVRRLILGKWKN